MTGLFERFYIKKLRAKKYYNGSWLSREMWSDSIDEALVFDSKEDVVAYLHADSLLEFPKFLEDDTLKIEIKSFFTFTDGK